MTAMLRRWIRPLGLVLLVLGLTLTPINRNRAHAQGPNDPGGVPAEGGEEKGTGRPLDGYFGTAILVFLALFIVGKSARR